MLTFRLNVLIPVVLLILTLYDYTSPLRTHSYTQMKYEGTVTLDIIFVCENQMNILYSFLNLHTSLM